MTLIWFTPICWWRILVIKFNVEEQGAFNRSCKHYLILFKATGCSTLTFNNLILNWGEANRGVFVKISAQSHVLPMTTEGVTKIVWLSRLQLLLNKVLRVFMEAHVIKELWATFRSAAVLLNPERVRPGINFALQFLLEGAKSIYSAFLTLKHIILSEIFFSVVFQWLLWYLEMCN